MLTTVTFTQCHEKSEKGEEQAGLPDESQEPGCCWKDEKRHYRFSAARNSGSVWMLK